MVYTGAKAANAKDFSISVMVKALQGIMEDSDSNAMHKLIGNLYQNKQIEQIELTSGK